MSTFEGLMVEFPEVRVDNFRFVAGVRPPLACFLSHVHSDHLAGLENLKAPFVYCSAATREILLRLERYPHRINFQLGILESRKQQYKHLANLLKPIPLETPTSIELAPGLVIQVTLFDANHCTGAVMFLFEGAGKAVLYTGDIRSEPWFVNNLTRNPLLVEYATGLKTLNCIYLDTSFTEDISFPTKAEGLKELLQKVSTYPADTKFHFAAWTFGYEEVWIALSRALRSPIHVDKYKMRLYQSLRGKSGVNCDNSGPFIAHEGPLLTGYKCANTQQPGCLTSDETVRIHSCEKGTRCPGIDDKTVLIRPIITRTSSGTEIHEMGIGGGAGDLSVRPELELGSESQVQQLIKLFASSNPAVDNEVRRKLLAGYQSTGKAVSLEEMGLDPEQGGLSLKTLVQILNKSVGEEAEFRGAKRELKETESHGPKVITFPYSRHSSYEELCHLVKVFHPLDIYPCTVDELNWHKSVSMKVLFGPLCSGTDFRHDREMGMLLNQRIDDEVESPVSYTTSDDSDDSSCAVEANLGEQNSVGLNNIGSSLLVDTFCDSGTENGLGTWADPEPIESEGDSDILQRDACEQLQPFEEYGNDISKPPDFACGVPSALPAGPLSRNNAVDNLRHSPRKRRRLSGEDLSSETSEEIMDGDDISSNLSVEGISYFDRGDRVYRCQDCGWEVWSPSGECTACGLGQPAYFEVILHKNEETPTNRRGHKSFVDDCAPAIVDSEGCFPDGVDFVLQQQLTGNYLDGRPAYESSTDFEDPNEYEMNSFIDDAPPSSNEGNDQEETEQENDYHSDYRHRYEQLVVQHAALESAYGYLAVEFEDFKRDILGSDYDTDDSEAHGDDSDDGYHTIDVETQDPPLSEVVVSERQNDSQRSVLSDGRLAARMEAFNGALGSGGEGWNMALISTDDNHTHLEVEL